jgi:hypothetical protein
MALWGTLTVAGYFFVPFLGVFFAAMFGADPKALVADLQLWEASKQPYASKALPFS